MTPDLASRQLPIHDSLSAIRDALAESASLVVEAPPGSGKSTIVPPALLDERWLAGKSILMLQPRRVAARAVAARMAELRGEPLGRSVGYRVRFENKVSAQTRIEVVTEGILTRRIQEDPALEGVGLVIFDEFHERSIHADLALAFALDAQAALRPDLRLLVMSATLDGAATAQLLGGAKRVIGTGVPYPVEISYLGTDPGRELCDTAARAVLRLLRAHEGDLLLFLPGVAEIKRVAANLSSELRAPDVEIFELYGDLPFEQQKRVLAPSERRRVILSTPIAETSLTIEGVRIVVDSGLQKSAHFDLSAGANRIVTERISLDSAEQRAGRAGRVAAGHCLRLWSESTQRGLRKNRSAEILVSDLAPVMLELAAWGADTPERLRFLDYPSSASVAQAQSLLKALGAVDESGKITSEGRSLLSFPAHPRIAHLLICARKLGLLPLACDVAALLDERDVFSRDDARGVDLSTRVDALLHTRKRGGGKMQLAERRAAEWAERAKVELRTKEAREGEVGLLLAFAYPERIAKRRSNEQGELRYLVAGGWGAKLPNHDPLQKSELLVIAHMQVGPGDGAVYLAAAIREEQLRTHFANAIRMEKVSGWDEASQSIRSENIERLGAIVLRTKPAGAIDDEARESALIAALRKQGVRSGLRWDERARELHARVETVNKYAGGTGLPNFSDDALSERLETLLAGRLHGMTRFEHLQRISVAEVLEAELDWAQRKKLDELAPTALQLPGGKSRRIDYTGAEGPVFEATVQELLGWRETPKLAGGKIPLLLHILSPARRPLQVTRDLASFWKNTYPDVRKEFRGRYPKHKWPENPVGE